MTIIIDVSSGLMWRWMLAEMAKEIGTANTGGGGVGGLFCILRNGV